ncbi:MAG TPA: SseB family protein [Candidatus Fusicatenibacter merdavium]|uniref:SseB family protein n=1 Tax=Candidatus Fusicatenibacter merdavium TaxID=2838600 RepID=A0A9D1XEK7_9FIRM|nr:SseB family protein [Candidatus Fusicatenibacter merdavium]
MIKKLQAMKTLYAIYSPLTKMPYIECDEETFDDEVHLFSDLDMAKSYCQEMGKNKIHLAVRKLEGEKVILQFYNELFQDGVNAVLYHDEVNKTRMELGRIIKLPETENMPNAPVRNPLLQLTAAYFFQEARRPEMPKDDPERNRHLHELEEEMLVNIGRSTLILPVIEKPVQEGEESKGKQLGAVVLKNNKNEIFQPVFTDLTEIVRMYPKAIQQFRAMNVPFAKLPAQVLKNSQGFVLNPAGFNLILNRDLLNMIAQRFVPQEESKEEKKPE